MLLPQILVSKEPHLDLFTHSTHASNKAIAIENDIRGLLRNFGLKVGVVGAVKFESRIQELVVGDPELTGITRSLLDARRKLREQFNTWHRKLLATVRDDPVCRRLMSVPGAGPVVALAYQATIDTPARFQNSKAVGAGLGLTPVLHPSGETNRIGKISRCGDSMMRTLLYEAAQVLLTGHSKRSWLKAWAMKIVQHRGLKNALVALARWLGVILHRLWSGGTEFCWTKEALPTRSTRVAL